MTNAGGGVRNMVIFVGLLYALKNIDQTDPLVINYCRIVFAVYVFLGMALQAYITRQISLKADLREIEVPPTVSPFAPAGDPPQPEKKTVTQYDIQQLGQQRSQILMNGLIIAFMHFQMGQVSPLVLSSVMGILRFLDDPMFKIHVLSQEATGALERPFKAEPNPLMNWLTGQAQPEADAQAAENENDDEDDDEDEDAVDDTADEGQKEAEEAEEESTEPKKTK